MFKHNWRQHGVTSLWKFGGRGIQKQFIFMWCHAKGKIGGIEYGDPCMPREGWKYEEIKEE